MKIIRINEIRIPRPTFPLSFRHKDGDIHIKGKPEVDTFTKEKESVLKDPVFLASLSNPF